MTLDHTENRHADKPARFATDSWTVGIDEKDRCEGHADFRASLASQLAPLLTVRS